MPAPKPPSKPTKQPAPVKSQAQAKTTVPTIDIGKSIANTFTNCSTFAAQYDCDKNLTCFWGPTVDAVKRTIGDSAPMPSCNPKGGCNGDQYWDITSNTCMSMTPL